MFGCGAGQPTALVRLVMSVPWRGVASRGVCVVDVAKKERYSSKIEQFRDFSRLQVYNRPEPCRKCVLFGRILMKKVVVGGQL